MRFDILTLFPEFFASPLKQSIVGRAIDSGLVEISIVNIRDFAVDRHRTTDDYPYGGGHGMVMKPEPVVKAIESLAEGGPRPKVILATPQGVPFSHGLALELSKEERIAVVCGRYEGVDERIRGYADIEISAGDFVLTGGEIPALMIIDSVARLVPGVLGEPESKEEESFSKGLLEYPQYTRPEVFRDMAVPQVLLSGNHAEIARWRRTESLRRTLQRRPDLIEKICLDDEDRRIIDSLKRET